MTFHKHAVPLPAMGDAAHFHMTIEALETIQTTMMDEADFGRDGEGMQVYFGWLDRLDLVRLKRIAEIVIVDATVEELLDAYTLTEIAERLSDAACLTLHGRTTAEQIAHREHEILDAMKVASDV